MSASSTVIVSGGAGLVPVEQVNELRVLHEEAQRAAEGSRERATEAVGIAYELGKRMTAIKARLGHGKFGLWFEAHEKVLGFTVRTAQKYMGLANTNHGSYLEEGGLRAAYLKLGIVPAKRRPDDQPRRVVANKSSQHLKWINDLGKWIRRAQAKGAKPTEFICLKQLHAQLDAIFGRGKRP
jgi:hypothetical protein